MSPLSHFRVKGIQKSVWPTFSKMGTVNVSCIRRACISQLLSQGVFRIRGPNLNMYFGILPSQFQ